MRQLCIAAILAILLTGASGVAAIDVTVGGFGGMNIPILQDDAGSGPLFGLKVKLASTMPFVVEPYFVMISEGDVDHSEDDLDFTQEGGSIQSFGVDLSFGGYREEPGGNVYFVAGIGAYSREPGQEYREKQTQFGFDLGLGMVWKVAPMLDFDISGRLLAFTLENGGSRKGAGIAAGLNYYFKQ